MISKKCEYDYKGKRFYILEDDHGAIWGIPSEYFIGRYLAKQFNGITGHRSESLAECIQKLKNEVDVNELVSKGVPDLVATVSVVLNMPIDKAIAYCKNHSYPL